MAPSLVTLNSLRNERVRQAGPTNDAGWRHAFPSPPRKDKKRVLPGSPWVRETETEWREPRGAEASRAGETSYVQGDGLSHSPSERLRTGSPFERRRAAHRSLGSLRDPRRTRKDQKKRAAALTSLRSAVSVWVIAKQQCTDAHMDEKHPPFVFRPVKHLVPRRKTPSESRRELQMIALYYPTAVFAQGTLQSFLLPPGGKDKAL